SRRGDFIRTGSAFSFCSRTKSCNWNIDLARHKLHLVGRLPLFARCKTRGVALSHCSSTNDLWRNLAFVCRRGDERTIAVSSQFHFHIVARLICLSRNHWRRGRVYGVHLAAASL